MSINKELIEKYLDGMEERFESEIRIFKRKLNAGEFEEGGDPLASFVRGSA